jgi:hypothetical protein
MSDYDMSNLAMVAIANPAVMTQAWEQLREPERQAERAQDRSLKEKAAQLHTAASMYGATTHAGAQRYGADKNLEGQKHRADAGARDSASRGQQDWLKFMLGQQGQDRRAQDRNQNFKDVEAMRQAGRSANARQQGPMKPSAASERFAYDQAEQLARSWLPPDADPADRLRVVMAIRDKVLQGQAPSKTDFFPQTPQPATQPATGGGMGAGLYEWAKTLGLDFERTRPGDMPWHPFLRDIGIMK